MFRGRLRHALVFLLAAPILALAACNDAVATRTGQPAEDAQFPPVTPVASVSARERDAPPARLSAGLDQVGYSDTLRFDSMLLGGYRVIFGRTLLSETVQQFGVGVRLEQGSGGDYEAWVCYAIPGDQRIWLVSNEVGGGEFITDVRAALDPEASADEDCPELPRAYRNVTLDPAFWLGAHISQVERRFGEAPVLQDWRVYSRAVAQTRNNLSFTDNFSLSVRVENNTVVAMNVSKTTLSREGL